MPHMIFAGFQPFTMSDFPGHLAAMVFTQGCNFRCPFCHNGTLLSSAIPEGSGYPEEEVIGFLKARRKRLDGLVVTGGEPALHPGLDTFLEKVKALGYTVKLDTNGSRPDVLVRLLNAGLIDYIAMDVKAPLGRYHQLAGVHVNTRDLEESIANIAWSGVAHEFRTTVVEPLLSRRDIRAIRALLPRASKHKLQRFVPENALDPALRDAAAYAETGAA
jgi:pyruvate formate lyase activating enzyme